MRRWKVAYAPSAASGRSLLVGVQESGEAGLRGLGREFQYSGQVVPPNPFLDAVSTSGIVSEYMPRVSTWTVDFKNLRWHSQLADLNQDGFADLVRVFMNTPTGRDERCGSTGSVGAPPQRTIVQLQRGRAQGAPFDAPTIYTFDNLICFSNTDIGESVLTDLNGDGFPDLVQYLINGGVVAFQFALGSSAGFGPMRLGPSRTWPNTSELRPSKVRMVVGDFNGDQLSDFAMAILSGTREVLVFSGDAAAGLTGPVSTPWSATVALASEHFRGISVGDVTGDGTDDLVVLYSTSAGATTQRVRLAVGKGAPSGLQRLSETLFTPTSSVDRPSAHGTGDPGQDLVLSDVDGDGNQEALVLATGSAGGTKKVWAVIDGLEATATYRSIADVVAGSGAAYGHSTPSSVPSPMSRYAHVGADFNGDGRGDLFAWYRGAKGSDAEFTFQENGAGLFAQSASSERSFRARSTTAQQDGLDWFQQWHLAVGDMNGDGIADLYPWAFYESSELSTTLVVEELRGSARDANPNLTPTTVEWASGCGRNAMFCTSAQGLCPRERPCAPNQIPNSVLVGTYNRDKIVSLIGDINGDGKSDFVLVDDGLVAPGDAIMSPRVLLTGPGQVPDLLIRAGNGLGGTTRIAYRSSALLSGAVSPEATLLVGASKVPDCGGRAALGTGGSSGACGVPQARPVPAVERIESDDGQGLVRSWSFSYRNGRARHGKLLERLSLGFQTVSRTDEQRGVAEEKSYYQTPGREGLLLSKVRRDVESGKPLRTEARSYAALSLHGTSAVVLLVPAETSVEEYFFERSGTAVTSALERVVSQTVNTRDSLGFPTSESTCTAVGARKECETTATSYFSHAMPDYWLARVSATYRATDRGDVLEAHRYNYRTGFAHDLLKHEALLLEDTTAAGCTLTPEVANICDSYVSFGWARWVPIVRNQNPNAANAPGFDAYGNITHSLDALDHLSIRGYDGDYQAYPAREENALGHVTTHQYDRSGRRIATTDPNLQSTSFDYDGLGRRLRVRRPLPGVTVAAPSERWEYLDVGLPTQRVAHFERISSTDEKWTLDWVDGFGETYAVETSSVGSASVLSVRSKAIVGRALEDSRSRPFLRPLSVAAPPAPNWVRATFDGLGRLTNEREDTSAGQSRTRLSVRYSPFAEVYTDAAGSTTTKRYDLYRRLASVVDAMGAPTSFNYDRAGNLIEVIRADGAKVEMSYDSFGRKRLHAEPETGSAVFEYDDLGHQTYYRGADGHSLTTTYDAGGRPFQAVDDLGQTTDYIYDNPSVLNGLGRLATVRYPLGRTVNHGVRTITEYDAVGRVVRAEDSVGPHIARRRVTYDDLGRVLRKYFPDDTAAVPSYQENVYEPKGGQVRTISAQFGATRTTVASFLNYLPTGHLAARTTAGIRSTYSYDAFQRLERLASTSAAQPNLQAYKYTFDALGNVSRLDDLRPSTLIGGVETSETMTFAYDKLSRLRSASGPLLGTQAQAFDYDVLGNITLKDGTKRTYSSCGALQTCISGSVAGTATWQVINDSAGNRQGFSDLTAQRRWDYSYDALGQLLSAEYRPLLGGSVLSRLDLAYDASGARVRKIYVDSQGRTATTYYLGSDYELRESSRGAGVSRTKHIDAPDGRRLASYTDGATLPGQQLGSTLPPLGSGGWHGDTLWGEPTGWKFIFSNHIGSSSVVTNESGQVLSRLAYAPYGEQVTGKSRGTDTTTRKYAGYEFDEESGLHLAGARYYDTRTARFLTPDSVTPGGGQRPQGWNRYAYSRNNPITFMDPSGHLEGPFTNSLHDEVERAVSRAWGAAKWAADAGVGFVAGIMPVPAPLGMAPFGNEGALGMGAMLGASAGIAIDTLFALSALAGTGAGDVVAGSSGVGAVAIPTITASGLFLAAGAATAGLVHQAHYEDGLKHAMSEGEQHGSGESPGARSTPPNQSPPPEQPTQAASAKNNRDKSALIDMAKKDKRSGISSDDAAAYNELGKEAGVPVRGPEAHPDRPHGKDPHIHVGPVDHIPVQPEPKNP